ERDKNNWAPRVGFNYRFGAGHSALGWLTGDRKLVMRGGYARAYDAAYTNIALNIASSFPFVLAYTVPVDSATALTPNAFGVVSRIRGGSFPTIPNPDLLTRTVVDRTFRAPVVEQFSLQFQRELAGGFVLSSGYVGTKGTALFQSVDGNPTVATPPGIARTVRVSPNRGVIRLRCNCTPTTYH